MFTFICFIHCVWLPNNVWRRMRECLGGGQWNWEKWKISYKFKVGATVSWWHFGRMAATTYTMLNFLVTSELTNWWHSIYKFSSFFSFSFSYSRPDSDALSVTYCRYLQLEWKKHFILMWESNGNHFTLSVEPVPMDFMDKLTTIFHNITKIAKQSMPEIVQGEFRVFFFLMATDVRHSIRTSLEVKSKITVCLDVSARMIVLMAERYENENTCINGSAVDH